MFDFFDVKYRIVQSKDTVLDKDYYYIESRQYPWNSWIPTVSIGRFTTLKAAQDEVYNLRMNNIIHYQ